MHHTCALPLIIQGGMGIGISGWPLARAVLQSGHLGVVSGTALDSVGHGQRSTDSRLRAQGRLLVGRPLGSAGDRARAAALAGPRA
jgi:NAD(P)H-dependent flavin oxidoreductase YrpB (nitropropane dioxygenase family)